MSESEQEKTDPRVVVMSEHAAYGTNCYGYLQRCGSHVETDAGISYTHTHTHTHTHTEGRMRLMTQLESQKRERTASQAALKWLQQARKGSWPGLLSWLGGVKEKIFNDTCQRR